MALSWILMKRKRSILGLILVLMATTPAVAEEPSPAPAPRLVESEPALPESVVIPITPQASPSPETTPTATPPAATPTAATAASIFEGKEDLVSLGAAMAAAQYEIRPSFMTRTDLITNLSRAVDAHCMGTLPRDLAYTPNHSPYCEQLITYTLSIDPQNPDAICARDGIDASTCREAYREVATSSSVSYRDSASVMQRFGNDSTIHDAEVSMQVDAILKDLYPAKSAYATEKNETNRLRLAALYITLLDRVCAAPKIAPNPDYLKDRTAQDRALQSTGAPAAKEKRFADMLSRLANTPGRPTPIPAVISRTRLMSISCLDHVREALQYIPELPRAICHRDGFFSPNCIDALRKNGATLQPSSHAAGTPSKGGLQPF